MILYAEQLGYDEAWVGEHHACKTAPIPDPPQFMATPVPVTNAALAQEVMPKLRAHAKGRQAAE